MMTWMECHKHGREWADDCAFCVAVLSMEPRDPVRELVRNCARLTVALRLGASDNEQERLMGAVIAEFTLNPVSRPWVSPRDRLT